MGNQETLIQLFQEAAKEIGHHEFSDLSLKTEIAELGIDSVELLEIFGYVEEELDIELSDDELSGIRTLQDLSTIISTQTT